jgi:hypothetical protein
MFSPGSSKKIENENGVKGKDDAKSHFLSKLRRLQFVGGKVHHFKDQISHEI